MDAAASIITFVTLTLATIKSCHQLFSAVQDAPEKLKQIIQAISSLVSAFEQIENAPELSILCSSASIRRISQDCKADFARLETKIQKVEVLPAERLVGILWKRLKIAFSEKDLPWMLAVVNRHIDAVTLEVNLMQSRTLHQVEGNANRILAQQCTQSTRIEEQTTILSAIRQQAFDATAQNSLLRAAVETLTQKFIEMPSLSQSQADSITERLSKLEEETTKLNLSSTSESIRSQPSSSSSKLPTTELPTASEELSALDESLRRLCRLVNNVECTVESADATDIVNDLDLIIRSAAGWTRINSTSPHDDTQNTNRAHDLNQIRGRFLTAPDIKLNQGIRYQHPAQHRVIGQKRSYAEYSGASGTLRLQRQVRRLLDQSSTHTRETQENRDSATLTIKNVELPFSITLSTYQRMTDGLLSILPPSLIISPVLPRNHPVFETIRSGQLDKLRRLLFDQKAWLKARDEWGASLLHYAYDQPAIMQLLIGNDAEVNELADCFGVDGLEGYYSSPLGLSICENFDNSNCSRQLLIAGADPTLPMREIGTENDEGTPLDNVCLQPNFKYLKATLDEVGTIYDILGYDNGGSHGFTLLHISCLNYSLGNIRILLERGADINASDKHGDTCLILALEEVASREILLQFWDWERHFEFLTFLLSNGADVARNNRGETPSRLAYHLALANPTSFVGDVWDCALAACGYDVAAFRIEHPRQGRYSGNYTLDVFKEMWDGMEERCPYYKVATVRRACQCFDWSLICMEEACPFYAGESECAFESDESSNESSDEGGVRLDSGESDDDDLDN